MNGIVDIEEVSYTEEKPELDEGPFLREERIPIDAMGHCWEVLFKGRWFIFANEIRSY